MPDVQEYEKPNELPSEFPKVSLDAVYKVGDLFLADDDEGKFDEFNRMVTKTQDAITSEEPDLYAFLQGELKQNPEKAIEFISGVMFVRGVFDEEGIKLPPLTWDASMSFAEEILLRCRKVRRITDADAKKALKGTESETISHPIDRAEENPSLMSFISALGIKENGTFTPFGQGAMFYYEIKRRQFFAEQMRKSPLGSDIQAEGGDVEQRKFPEPIESKTFEVEGDIWDYDKLAEVMGKIGKAFLDRFYQSTYSEEEKARLLEEFVKAIKEDHPIQFMGSLELPGSRYEGYPIVLSFNESYDTHEALGPFEYDDENRLILATMSQQELAKETAVTNHCDITITASPRVFEHLRDRFPEKAAEFKEDMAKFAEELAENVDGIKSNPLLRGPNLPGHLGEKAKEKPYDFLGFTTLRFDEEQFKKGRGKVMIVAEKYSEQEHGAD